MERPSGSYIIDDQGKMQPNPDDEAMNARKKIEDVTAKEVKADAKTKADNSGKS
ncbi:MAG: hypothetical protein M0Z71_04700 [Nitrospiraceae bacterium]|nr:hypothetical protein [Nitrospiraceae bacterium]